jgi:hypothetical protein
MSLDIYLTFPITPDQESEFEKLGKYFGAIEELENAFDIEFSCGDGLFLSDIEDDDSLLAKYDGKVCTDSMPRHRYDGKEFIRRKFYHFTAKYFETLGTVVFYLNGKKTSEKYVD